MNIRWQIAQSAEIRWWQKYLRHKPVSDYLDWKLNYWKKLLAQLQLPEQFSSDTTILDAGCGPAGIFIALSPAQITASDPLLEDYEKRLVHFDRNSYPNVKFRTERLEDLNDTSAYDYVFCLNAINHVADLRLCLEHLTKAAKPDGKLILSIDAHNYKIFKALFRLLPGDILHPHQYDLAEYRQLLKDAGWEIMQEQCLKKEFFFDYWIFVAHKPVTF